MLATNVGGAGKNRQRRVGEGRIWATSDSVNAFLQFYFKIEKHDVLSYSWLPPFPAQPIFEDQATTGNRAVLCDFRVRFLL